MKLRCVILVCLAALVVVGIAVSGAYAQRMPREPDFSEQVDSFYDTLAEKPNQDKFFSILIFIVLGGACTYAEMRGIKKVVSEG
ncbi:MAG: hypothetical protein J7M19_05690 [Planctomycetes bacterium]|nr:hypothetical protein [Planctomycetota bacterium]